MQAPSCANTRLRANGIDFLCRTGRSLGIAIRLAWALIPVATWRLLRPPNSDKFVIIFPEFMSTPSSKAEPDFTRRSDTESICMWCYLTVRVRRPEELANEEREHAATCRDRPDSRYHKPKS